MHDANSGAWREVRAFTAALLLYAAFYAAFFFRSLLSGNYIAPSDSLDFGVAAYLSPPTLWTQGMYSGYPIGADPQALTWYPLLHLFRALELDWNAFLISAYVIASAACCLLVRRLSGSALAGAFSGFAFGFSGVLLGHIGHFNQVHAAAWVPLLFYGLQLVREGAVRSGALVGAAGGALMWLAGHPQVAVYSTYVAAAAVGGGIVIDRPSRGEALVRARWSALTMALALGLSAVAVVPMIELGEFSRRAEPGWELYSSKALPPWQLLGLILPFAFGGFWTPDGIPVPYFGQGGPAENTAYVGFLPLALAVAAPFVPSRLRSDARLWTMIAIVAAVLCLGAATPVGTAFFYAPGYASFRVPARHLFVVALCVAVTSGLVFAEIVVRTYRTRILALAIAATGAAGAVAFGIFTWRVSGVRALVAGNLEYIRWTIVWPMTLVLALLVLATLGGAVARFRTRFIAAALLVALHVFDLGMLHYRMPGYRLMYADIVREEAVLHPKMAALREELLTAGERVLASDGSKNQFLLPNLTRGWNVPAASGTGSLGIERYLDVLGMGGPGDIYANTLSPPHVGLDVFSVRYVLVPQRWPVIDELKRDARWSKVEDLRYYENDPDTHYTLFRNERARPRAWCVPRTVRVSPEEALRAVRTGHLPDGRTFDPAREALVEADALPGWRTEPASGTSEVTVRLGEESRYLVNSSGPCLLVLSEVHYPWWRASVDGIAVDAVRVNHAMVGVPVPAGAHVVRVWLQPLSLWAGGSISVASLLALVGAAAWRRRRRPAREAQVSAAHA